MAKANHSINAIETSFVIEGLRKLALQRDTLRKYALTAEAEAEDEFEGKTAEDYTADIEAIRNLLSKLGDTKALVLKSERKAKPKAKAKAKPKAKAVAEAKARHPQTTARKAKVAK